MKTIVKYVSLDGKTFTDEKACVSHELKKFISNELVINFIKENDGYSTTIKDVVDFLEMVFISDKKGIDWDLVPSVYMYVTMDEDGSWWGSTDLPILDEENLVWNLDDSLEWERLEFDYTYPIWKNAFFRRP